MGRRAASAEGRTGTLHRRIRALAAALAGAGCDGAGSAMPERLGARYHLSGRLNEHGSHVGLSLLLTDAEDGVAIWADRRQAPLADLLAGLDDLAGEIAARIEKEILHHEADRAFLRPIADLDAWSAYHRAVRTMLRFKMGDADEVDALLHHAATLDRRSARIRAAQSHLAWQRAFLLSGRDRSEAGTKAIGLAEEALALDDRDPQAHWALGRSRLIAGQTDAARTALRRSIALNPSFASAYYSLGWTMSHDGTPAPAAIPLARTARRLSPLDPIRYAFDLLEADLSYFSGDIDSARKLARGAASHPEAHHQARAIASWLLHATGAEDEAHRLAAQVRRDRPGYGFADYRAAVPARGIKLATVERHFRALGF